MGTDSKRKTRSPRSKRKEVDLPGLRGQVVELTPAGKQARSPEAVIRTDIGARLLDGRRLLREAYKKEDAAKLGILRAGNSGIMSDTGMIAGSCHRIAHLRQLGIETDPPSPSTVIMFQVGTANEDIVYNDLKQTSAPDEVILRETEIPTSWVTRNGTKVTGRPDMVICRKSIAADERNGVDVSLTPVLGLELKSVASVWTSRSVLFEGEPKLAHLAQAGHYMWQLGVPFRLIYKQYALQAMPDFAQKFFPKQGQPNSEYMEYGDDGKPKAIKPFEIVYELVYLEGGCLHYRREGQEEWTPTVISTADIHRFYEFVSEMQSSQVLGPRPITIGPDGNEKRYTNCNYCPVQSVCDKHDPYRKKKGAAAPSYRAWLSDVRLLLDSGSKVK